MSPGEQAASLYGAWLNAIAGFYRAMTPGAPGVSEASAAGSGPSPEGLQPGVRPILDAIGVAQQAFNQLYVGYARLLGDAAAGKGVAAWLETGQAEMQKWLENLGELSQTAMRPVVDRGAGSGAAGGATEWLRAGVALWQSPQLWQSFLSAPGAMLDPRDSHPLVAGLERTFTALGDALGAAPSRALSEAYRELFRADADRRRAQLEYFLLIGRTWLRVNERVAARLREMGERDETVGTLMALVRLWTGVADEAVHEAMQSEEGLKVTAAYIRAAAQFRLQQNRVVEIVSQFYNVPTRRELDEAYREIHELKQRLRGLERRAGERPGANVDGGPES